MLSKYGKYSGEVSLYYKSRKLLHLVTFFDKDGKSIIEITFLKNPKYENRHLYLKKSDMKCLHRRKLHTFDIENRTFGSHPGHNEWLVGKTFSELFSTDALAFIVDDLVALRENPDFKEKILTRKNIDKHIKIFTTADQNSEEFKKAYDWLIETYTNDKEDQRFVELDI